MKIATIMSVYKGDRADWLDRALCSIEGQLLPEGVESRLYLALDGPVPDDVRKVVESHSASIYQLVQIPFNGGLANALNALIGALRDETLVFRMDADDVSLPERYAAQMTFLAGNPDVDILGTDILEIDVLTQERRVVRFYDGRTDVRKHLCRGVPVAHPTVCMRRKVLDIVGAYPSNGTNEDIAFWFQCAKAGFRFANVHQPLLEFTIGERFWGRRSFSKARGELRTYLQGIASLHGMTWRYVLPMARFCLRLAPVPMVKWAYRFRAQLP